MKKIFICLVSLILLLCGCSVNVDSPKPSKDEPVNAVYVKAVWITYFELEKLTANSNTDKDFEKAVKSAFKEIKSDGFNTVTVQVRPCADAFYKSDYFPVSKYCFGVQGCELKYDPLEIMVETAHKLGLRIEAWINPYRVSQSKEIDDLSDNNIAKAWYKSDDKKSNVYVDDKIYFNPASSEVKELIVNGVKEIVEKYAVDAIHFDDYFYPSTSKAVDKKEYRSYKKSGGDLSLADWRRENVSDMVKSVYSAIKKVNSSVEFGISPQSKISANYNNLYADVERWATEEGFVDYICPQIYFGFYNEVQPFTKTAKDWASLTTSCRLYVGLPLYKSGQEDKFASVDKDYAINEFKESNNVISRQISYLSQLENVNGFYIYSYSYLIDEENESVAEEVKNIKAVM
ncbi:MAG: family 10 glycosylhydrolase [Eubacterium sp.]|nr:family 10 glycosylhydrolase [Eubacterium sp.]